MRVRERKSVCTSQAVLGTMRLRWLSGVGTCFIAPGRQAWTGGTTALSTRPAAPVAAA